MKPILLASQSPRRKQLVQLLPWRFEVCTEEVEEQIDEALTPEENVQALARQKAEAVALKYPDQWVIGADTVVCYEGKIMGKPKDEVDAKNILNKLSGKTHQVYTGVALIHQDKGVIQTFYQETQVTMQLLSEEEIETYIQTKEPMDKAGAYGIQGYGARYIVGIKGDYYNVMGLPVHQLYQELKKHLI
ncbi:MAG: septum formation inhibitor Maf [Cellulosilyticum sp.]|nr:septum formation inhibitor Maf [Cellulosilyticum sp.]